MAWASFKMVFTHARMAGDGVYLSWMGTDRDKMVLMQNNDEQGAGPDVVSVMASLAAFVDRLDRGERAFVLSALNTLRERLEWSNGRSDCAENGTISPAGSYNIYIRRTK